MNEKRVGYPITIGDIVVVPLEKVSSYHVNTDDGFNVCFLKEPIGIAVRSPQGKWAIDIMDGAEVPVESFYEQIHGLQQLFEDS
jgi:hypothetical protein